MKRQNIEVSMGTKTLRGSLWIPDAGNGLGKCPAVVFSHGGGPQNRGGWCTTFEDKPDEMAQFFIDHGCMVALWDKPRTGESTGDWKSEGLADCADNLIAVVEWTKKIDQSNGTVGVWGLSQGGMIGPPAGSKSRSVDFVISASSSWVSSDEQEIFRIQRTLKRDGMTVLQIEEAVLATNEFHALAHEHAPWDRVLNLCKAHEGKEWYKSSFLWYVSQWGERWYDGCMKQPESIAPDMGFLKALNVPVLFQWGLEDDVVDARRNRQFVEQAIPPTFKELFSLLSYEGLDHGLCDYNSKKRPSAVYCDILNWLKAIDCAPNKEI